jgi:DNA polymerase-4
MQERLQPILDKLWRHCENSGVFGRTVTLKVKYADFELITRSRSCPLAVDSRDMLQRAAFELLASQMPVPKGVRLLGVTVSSLGQEEDEATPQLSLAI